MNKDTRNAINDLLTQVEELLELNFWEIRGDDTDEWQREGNERADNATRIVRRYLYEEEARAEVKKYAGREERAYRAQGKRITNRAEWERNLLAGIMKSYDERQAQGGN